MKQKALYPIIISTAIVAGIAIGYGLSIRATRNIVNTIGSQTTFAGKQQSNGKAAELLNIIDRAYVDTIDMAKLNDAVAITALSQLDPHSSYIPAEDLASANEQLEGSFSGIGVQFNIMEDTIYVVDVISGGPAERGGLLPGDRITEVNDTLFVGKELNNEKVFRKLRGEKGSCIKIGVARRGTPEKLTFDIVRDDIPVHSVDIAYMVTDDIGLIAVNSFGAHTYREFLEGISKLRYLGAQKLIIDLRGNTGGYLEAAANMINEFLHKGDLIVYVEGRAYPRAESRANGTGSFQSMPIAVLVDEFSASASEIFAGAVQDNDRGLIIGRRSFGKGLVQQPFTFADGSEARITVARYYTPSGRCIQKPYTRGKAEDYESDIWNRYLHGEFFSADSIHQQDSTEYHTTGGRVVYGGGGIMPDIFIPRDTCEITAYFTRLVNKALIYKFALKYTEQHRARLSQFAGWQQLDEYLTSQNAVNELTEFGRQNGVPFIQAQFDVSHRLITRHLHSYIVRNILGDEGFYPLTYRDDPEVQRAVAEFKKTTNLPDQTTPAKKTN